MKQRKHAESDNKEPNTPKDWWVGTETADQGTRKTATKQQNQRVCYKTTEPERLQQNNTTRKTATKQQNQKDCNKTTRKTATKQPERLQQNNQKDCNKTKQPERLQQNKTTRKTATKQHNQKDCNKTTEKTNFSETNHKLTAMEYTSQIIGQDCSNFVQVQNMLIIGRISLNLRL